MAHDKAKRQRFHRLVEEGISIRRASERVGINPRTGQRWKEGLAGADNSKKDMEQRLQISSRIPDPRTFEQLPDDAKRSLEDFNVFSELYLARHPSPWRSRVANQSVEMLLDKSEKHYVVCNLPPGVGKSTLWTLDLPLWLMLGGGFQDPAYGRALRFMLGHASKEISSHYVLRLRRMLELTRPYWDKESRKRAERVILQDFGRMRPDTHEGEERIWAKDQFLVAQLGSSVDYYEKEPTVQAASMNSEFIGERIDYAAWDDLVTEKTSRDAEVSGRQDQWFEKEAETRIEPGGVLWLVGQRLSPADLFRQRLNQSWVDEEGQPHMKYVHIVFPVHNETTCDGEHRQWDTYAEGCILDESRVPWREIMKVRGSNHYRTVYQQEDSNPDQVLVPPIWLDGGVDLFGADVPGCWDHERSFMEHPRNVVPLVNYATVDVAAGGYWAIEWWAVHPQTRINYLIFGIRRRLSAGGPDGFLDWDNLNQCHVGWMEKLQKSSVVALQPIRVWVIEANSAQKHLFQYNHYDAWRMKWQGVTVLPHQTQKNKNDPILGVEARLPQRYHDGMKRLPRSNRNPDSLNYIEHKRLELTTYPNVATKDTVMADWFGEAHLDEIIRLGTHAFRAAETDLKLPPYLRRQRKEISTRARV